jgi:hypothetical protein
VPAVTVSGVTADFAPSWNPFAPGALVVAYSVENSGNTRLTGIEALSAAGPAGLFGVAAPSAQLSEIIPGSTIEVRRELPILSIGWLSGSLRLSPEGVGLGAGSVDPVVVDFSTPAVPFGLLAVLILAAALAVGVVLLVRRTARRRAAADPAP